MRWLGKCHDCESAKWGLSRHSDVCFFALEPFALLAPDDLMLRVMHCVLARQILEIISMWLEEERLILGLILTQDRTRPRNVCKHVCM